MDQLANNESVVSRYQKFSNSREPFLTRARACSRLTIPSLIPPEGHKGDAKLHTPYQSMGSRGVNNISAKLLLSLLPPNAPFFRLLIDDAVLEKYGADTRTGIEEAFGKIERLIMKEIEGNALRVGLFEALKLLVVGGNALIYLPKEGGIRVYGLDRYVVHRTPMGVVLEIITHESSSPMSLSQEVREACGVDTNMDKGDAKPVDVYTIIKRETGPKGGVGKWVTYQEINEVKVPGSEGTYPIDKCPYIPLRFTKIDGEDYGRAYVEEYLGDLTSLEALSQALVEGAAASAKVLFLVKPNGTTRAKTIANTRNGAVVEGNADDVTVLQLQKAHDFNTAYQMISMINERLAHAFLLNSAVRRPGERVTAEEIRYMAGELEDALGGIYSIMSQELQLPLVNRLMHQMEKRGKLPSLPEGIVQPAIVTGIDAIGRGQDLNRLQGFIQDLGVIAQFKPEYIQRLDPDDLLSRLATARGIDTEGMFMDDARFQQVQQQQAMMQMVQQTAPGMLQEATKAVINQQQGNENGSS